MEGGWDEKKFAGGKQYMAEQPEKLKMSKAEFDKMYNQFYDLMMHPRPGGGGL